MIINHQSRTNIVDVVIVDRPRFADDRGYLSEFFRLPKLERLLGRPIHLEQFNITLSLKNVVRGIHVAPFPKIITCVRGTVQQVIVDCRKGSETFGRYDSIIMGEEESQMVYVPPGCGNGFLTLSDESIYFYGFGVEWRDDIEQGLLWNDPTVGIKWETENPIVSIKDQNNPTFAKLFEVASI